MSKHHGINATRDVLKDQLALAASEIERLRCEASSVTPMMRVACLIGLAVGYVVGVAL